MYTIYVCKKEVIKTPNYNSLYPKTDYNNTNYNNLHPKHKL